MTIFNRNRVVEIARVELASSASVPSSKNRYDQKVKAPGSKSQESVSGTKTYPTFPKYGKNHMGKCLAGKKRCFGCGQSSHRLRDCSFRQGHKGGNGRAQSTTSSAPPCRPTHHGNSSGTTSSQRQNRLYALLAHQDQ